MGDCTQKCNVNHHSSCDGQLQVPSTEFIMQNVEERIS